MPTTQTDRAMPKVAMIMAAGLGKRMRHLTEDRPKPMVELAGRPMIDHSVMKLHAAGITRLVVNLFYKGDILRQHLEETCPEGMEILFSQEDELLDTGGGVTNALPLLGDAPFFILNGDMFWQDGTASIFSRMAGRWDDKSMDALLLMVPTVSAIGYDGIGDFTMDASGLLTRRAEQFVSPFLYGGMQLVHPRLFKGGPKSRFSTNIVWDKAIEGDRLYGIHHDGSWMHIGTPETVDIANARLADR